MTLPIQRHQIGISLKILFWVGANRQRFNINFVHTLNDTQRVFTKCQMCPFKQEFTVLIFAVVIDRVHILAVQVYKCNSVLFKNTFADPANRSANKFKFCCRLRIIGNLLMPKSACGVFFYTPVSTIPEWPVQQQPNQY